MKDWNRELKHELLLRRCNHMHSMQRWVIFFRSRCMQGVMVFCVC
jgi:hypothetical protein